MFSEVLPPKLITEVPAMSVPLINKPILLPLAPALNFIPVLFNPDMSRVTPFWTVIENLVFALDISAPPVHDELAVKTILKVPLEFPWAIVPLLEKLPARLSLREVDELGPVIVPPELMVSVLAKLGTPVVPSTVTLWVF